MGVKQKNKLQVIIFLKGKSHYCLLIFKSVNYYLSSTRMLRYTMKSSKNRLWSSSLLDSLPLLPAWTVAVVMASLERHKSKAHFLSLN